MKKLWAIVLVISIAFVAWSLVKINNMPRLLQYVENNPKLESLDNEINYTKELLIPKAAFTINQNSDTGQLHAVNHSYFNDYHIRLLEGRMLYEGEKDNSLLIDKKLSLKLSNSESPLGKSVMVNQIPFTVVGVFDSAPNKVFSTDAYIPFDCAVKQKMSASLITYSILEGHEDVLLFKTKFDTNKIWVLSKEKQRSMLLMKFILFLYGIIFVSRNVKPFINKVKQNKEEISELLMDYYPEQIKLKIAKHIGFFILGLSLIALGYGVLIYFIVGAVLSFPEWLPEILVDYNMIMASYIGNMQNTSSLVTLKTNQILGIEHYGKILNIFMVMTMFSISTILFNRKGKTNNV